MKRKPRKAKTPIDTDDDWILHFLKWQVRDERRKATEPPNPPAGPVRYIWPQSLNS